MKKTELTIAFVFAAMVATGCSEEKTQERHSVKVKTMMVTSNRVDGSQSYSGTIDVVNGTSLSFAGMGAIKSLYVQEGQNVKAGQVIGEIEASSSSNTVAMAHAATLQAQEMVRQAEDSYKRMKMLHDNGSLPEIKWVEVETKVAQAKQMLDQALASEKIAQKGLSDTKLIAPFSGYISKKQADVGQNVAPGQPVATLVNIDRVYVKLSVPEDEIVKMKIGQKISFQVSSLGNTTFTGTVGEKSVTADPISHSYIVKALVTNKNHLLLPGMVCDVYTAENSESSVIMLPANIIQINFDNRKFVWVDEDGAAKRVFVEIGECVGENVIITNGLSQGDKVIVEGQQKVSSGMMISE